MRQCAQVPRQVRQPLRRNAVRKVSGHEPFEMRRHVVPTWDERRRIECCDLVRDRGTPIQDLAAAFEYRSEHGGQTRPAGIRSAHRTRILSAAATGSLTATRRRSMPRPMRGAVRRPASPSCRLWRSGGPWSSRPQPGGAGSGLSGNSPAAPDGCSRAGWSLPDSIDARA